MKLTREQYEDDIRAARAEAWDEGTELGSNHALLTCMGATVDPLRNPYRGEA